MKKSNPIANSNKGKTPAPAKPKKNLPVAERIDSKVKVGEEEISEFPEPPGPVCNLKIGSVDFWSEAIESFRPGNETDQIYLRHLRECILCSQVVDEYLETHPEFKNLFSKKNLLGDPNPSSFVFQEQGTKFYKTISFFIQKKKSVLFFYYLIVIGPLAMGAIALLRSWFHK
ncbi:hypothetical protein LEP1GSC047_3747 [Leptospira inadai serovar Lyme str. 10]|uniref:Uncharacterized protein n=2 Tax=Leptospira inadai serovar Lyme TaxID=293084 RepID=V6HC54_9LEPT|nr:hypothetical protein [Leptospira inadai]EQA37371.1 hypothetical protein LEP1GSC047_3747 [Leptospira inadai serovar Lyme str. 10]PNV75082.1 hypothetical protein BES34_011025 [Leptospira inadai serovar Lyme]